MFAKEWLGNSSCRLKVQTIKTTGNDAVIVPAKGICHEVRCGELLSRIMLLTMQPLKKPPASAAMMMGTRPNVEEVTPRCMVRAELTKLVETSRPYPRKRFDKNFTIASLLIFQKKLDVLSLLFLEGTESAGSLPADPASVSASADDDGRKQSDEK